MTSLSSEEATVYKRTPTARTNESSFARTTSRQTIFTTTDQIMDSVSLPTPTPSLSCLSLNSAKWLDASNTRLGNARMSIDARNGGGGGVPAIRNSVTSNETTIDYANLQDLLQTMILDLPNVLSEPSLGQRSFLSPSPFHKLLGQSICYEQSPFRTIFVESMEASDEIYTNNVTEREASRQWTIRLVYLAMMYHQNRWAQTEAKERYPMTSSSSHCWEELAAHNIGPFDFECPSAKYIAVSLADIGLGANIRGGTVSALLAGLASDRVVLFINQAPDGAHKYLRHPWQLSSCPRMDYQCFFLPSSPCVVTQADLAAAYSLTKRENAKVLQTGRLPAGHAQQNNKVWHMTVGFTPVTTVPVKAAQTLQQHALTLLSQRRNETNKAHDGDNAFYSILQRAIDQLVPAQNSAGNGGHGDSDSTRPAVLTALVVFSLRPNPMYARQMDDILKTIVPDNLEPEQSFGLPIRGKLAIIYIVKKSCWCYFIVTNVPGIEENIYYLSSFLFVAVVEPFFLIFSFFSQHQISACTKASVYRLNNICMRSRRSWPNIRMFGE